MPEPEGGAQADVELAAMFLRESIISHLRDLDGIASDKLRRTRRAKFRAMGVFT